MRIPKPIFKPPFCITRASHIVLSVKDLDASKRFYVDTLGFVVSDQSDSCLYLRGLEEGCHHSLVLEKGRTPGVARLGFRVLTDEDLDLVYRHFVQAGLSASWQNRPHQGRTLHVTDIANVPLEICATMETRPRLLLNASRFTGACPLRIDHFQVITPHVARALEFYMGMGFRLSEYVVPDGIEEPLFIFLQRKGNPHDIVFGDGPGPRLHHTAFMVPETHHLMHICDLIAEQGDGAQVEYGPNRHYAPGYARFVYLRDPDGYRIELFNTHYQTMDAEDEPIKWELSKVRAGGWGGPPPDTWLTEATAFQDTP